MNQTSASIYSDTGYLKARVYTALGAIPLVGDAFDFFFRSNTRNLKIIKKHLDKHHPGTIIIDQ